MAETPNLKSILKKTVHSGQFDLESLSTGISTKSQAEEKAYRQAQDIQQRKESQARILEAIEELIDFPDSFVAESSNGSCNLAQKFLSLIDTFQPNDYSSLIEERVCAGRCGYALCPNMLVRKPGRGGFSIDKSKGAPNSVVLRSFVERWCSHTCAERALYVQVQLSEEPAWARGEDHRSNIKLLRDDRSVQSDAAHSVEPGETAVGVGADDILQDVEQLSIRGQATTTGTDDGTSILSENIVERVSTHSAKVRIMAPVNTGASNAVEGYVPTVGKFENR